MSKQTPKLPINLPVTSVELCHLQWALQMDIELNEDQLNEKKALLKRIIQLEKAARSERGTSKRSRKGNVVNIKTDPRAGAADVLDKPAS